MISLTKMLTGKATVSERITYCGDKSFIPERLKNLRKKISPVVVLNLTRKCNLRCVHCYADASSHSSKELTTEEIKAVIDDLAEMKIPVLLFSGGEPLIRKDIFELAEYANDKGINCSLSTNGTLITEEIADMLKSCFIYVGVSLDGLKDVNDRFRGVEGSFERALQGLINARDAGIMTGIRFTVTRYNQNDIDPIINLLAENDIPRFCLYHLVPSGRADFKDDISKEERRKIIEYLMRKSVELVDEGFKTEILTVDNPVDGVFAYLKMRDENPDYAEKILEFLRYRGGDGSGERIANIDMYGYVHPNQFWWDYSCGNVKERKFSEIWLNPNELLIKLRNKEKYLRGKCGMCNFKDVCGGFRLRALRYGDLWGEDPDCYLSMEEISQKGF
ncbi:putative Fe-S oxidoreductase [Archaeoglobus sulfaticallidus PM70-1]|uniref:Putative Fe-S oxidoreductase n=1 Tax=Archaeoglobus sulfaticallidus PM70-1 TaxID=387631 RepID=N0BN80_9EURY|nr:radical SAM protein [Archaeoglobus sulfaticallidus]AGK62076.1 putative Fe-S oxidoreductase [Archaeoglobus sulfaticallidus PM70-1]